MVCNWYWSLPVEGSQNNKQCKQLNTCNQIGIGSLSNQQLIFLDARHLATVAIRSFSLPPASHAPRKHHLVQMAQATNHPPFPSFWAENRIIGLGEHVTCTPTELTRGNGFSSEVGRQSTILTSEKGQLACVEFQVVWIRYAWSEWLQVTYVRADPGLVNTDTLPKSDPAIGLRLGRSPVPIVGPGNRRRTWRLVIGRP